MSKYVDIAMEMVKAQASIQPMTPAQIGAMIKEIAKELEQATAVSTDEGIAEAPALMMDPKKCIRENTIVCAICGEAFKLLSKNHLKAHGHTPASYRKLCGYGHDVGLTSKKLSRERRERMLSLKLWARPGSSGNVKKAPVTTTDTPPVVASSN